MVRKILRRFLVNLVTSQRCIMLLIEIPIDQKEWLRFSILPEFALRAFEELDNSNFQGRLMHILPAKEQNTVRDGPSYLERAPGIILSPSSTSEADAQKYGVVGENNVKRAIIEQGWKKFLELMLILIEWSHEALENGKNVLMGFGSIKLNSVEAATKVCRDLQGTILDGHALTLQHCNAIAAHVQPMMPAVSSGVCQHEVPSIWPSLGPSLIPSPVPALEVGSIQMPVPIHSQMGSSVTHMHPSQPPFFQFGQLRYASPISQGIFPLAPQSVSFVQPPESSVNIPASQVSKTHQPESSVMLNDQPGVPKLFHLSQDSKPWEVTVVAAQNSIVPESESRSKSLVQDQRQHDMAVKKNNRYAANNNESQDPGPMSNGRGKRFMYTVKNFESRPCFPVFKAPHSDFCGFHRRLRLKFQHMEFRVRKIVEKRHTESVGSSANSGMDETLNFNGRMSGYSGRNGVVTAKQRTNLVKRPPAKRLMSSLNVPDSGEGNPKRNSNLVEDVDAPMQSGVVSKRQMLIDRRKQRERKLRDPVYSNKPSTPLVSEAASSIPSTSLVSDGKATSSASQPWLPKATSNVEVVPAFKNAIASQPLAPIGTPAHNKTDGYAVTIAHFIKALKNNSIPGISNNITNLAPGSSLANKSIAMPAYLGSWGSARINQQISPVSPDICYEEYFSTLDFSTYYSRAVSSDLGPPDSSRPDASVDHTSSAVESDHSFFLINHKQLLPLLPLLLLVGDEVIGASPVSTSDTQGFGDADIGSPQNSSSQMLSHFPGAPPHFPFLQVLNHTRSSDPNCIDSLTAENSGKLNKKRRTFPINGQYPFFMQPRKVYFVLHFTSRSNCRDARCTADTQHMLL
ncbi:hypothetical protein MKW92_035896 [Papaver armeniacum]|nr:hypothetical protein MKW92_035896 [Papaver armeniacum]